jgi:hypothetical protein
MSLDRAALVDLLVEQDPNLFRPEAEDRADQILGLEKPLDLDDPRDENAVADAIVRLKGKDGFLPLSEKYPWRFPQIPPGRCGARNPAVETVSCDLLAGHAGQHESVIWPTAGDFQPGAILKPSRAYWDPVPDPITRND